MKYRSRTISDSWNQSICETSQVLKPASHRLKEIIERVAKSNISLSARWTLRSVIEDIVIARTRVHVCVRTSINDRKLYDSLTSFFLPSPLPPSQSANGFLAQHTEKAPRNFIMKACDVCIPVSRNSTVCYCICI